MSLNTQAFNIPFCTFSVLLISKSMRVWCISQRHTRTFNLAPFLFIAKPYNKIVILVCAFRATTKPWSERLLFLCCSPSERKIDMFGLCFLCISQQHTRKKHKDTETQRHSDTKTQRHNDTETQRHRDTETQRHRDTKTQRHRDTKTRAHLGCVLHAVKTSCLSLFFILSKRIVAPATAMVDSRCPVRLQTQLTGEEERDELED